MTGSCRYTEDGTNRITVGVIIYHNNIKNAGNILSKTLATLNYIQE